MCFLTLSGLIKAPVLALNPLPQIFFPKSKTQALSLGIPLWVSKQRLHHCSGLQWRLYRDDQPLLFGEYVGLLSVVAGLKM